MVLQVVHNLSSLRITRSQSCQLAKASDRVSNGGSEFLQIAMVSMRQLMLGGLLLGLLNSSQRYFAASDVVDGFVAYCTGNNDSTGLCKNEETGRSYTCQIIPGAVIDCMSSRAKAFQCVWISSPIANSAEFWCDKSVDQMLRGEFVTSVTDKEFSSGKASGSGSSINDDEFEAEAHSLGGAAEALSKNKDGRNPSSKAVDQAELQIQIEQTKDLDLPESLPLLDLRSSDKSEKIDMPETVEKPSQKVVDGIEVQLQLQQFQQSQ